MEIYEKIKKYPRNVTPKELIELLETYGYVPRESKRSRGDHFYYRRPGYRTFPVPIGQNPIGIDIVKKALRNVELIIEENEE